MYMRERFHDVLPPMPDAVSFDVTQAAQWFLRDDENAYDMNDMSAMVPPYPEMWLEYLTPSMIRFKGHGLVAKHPKDIGGGCHILTFEIAPNEADAIVGKEYEALAETMQSYVGSYPFGGVIWPSNGKRFGPVKNTNPVRWLSVFDVYSEMNDSCLPLCTSTMLLDGKGKYILHSHTTYPVHAAMQKHRYSYEQGRNLVRKYDAGYLREINVFLQEGLYPFFFCLFLLHCRNVQTVDVPPQPAPILKQRAKKGVPFIQYKMLEVTPLRTVRQGGTRKDGTPEPKALHFVRGHFKDFSDKGLFGKYKGVYWWDSQVRGDSDKGIIDKDYKVSRD